MSFTPVSDTKFVSTDIAGKTATLLTVSKFAIDFGLNRSQSSIGLVVCKDYQGNFKIYKNNDITLVPLNENITDAERDIRVQMANVYYEKEEEIKRKRKEHRENDNSLVFLSGNYYKKIGRLDRY